MVEVPTSIQLPFKPCGVLHHHGGKVVEVVNLGHKNEAPHSGHSRDHWFFIGRVQWDDGSGTPERLYEIPPHMLASTTEEGHAEIVRLSELMVAYLSAHGSWRHASPQGWYAHRKPKV
jgi:hypothetical protein